MISVNLRTEEGRTVIRNLVAKCDVLLENFRPGTMERWGLGYEDLSAVNPGIVMVRISGFGRTGPYSARDGYGIIGDALLGTRHITADPDPPPRRAFVSMTYRLDVDGAVKACDKRCRTVW